MPTETFFRLPEAKRETLLRCARQEFARVPYPDASINRISAWVTGFRNLQKALLFALLQPNGRLKQLQDAGNFSRLMVEQEELKTMPFGDVWEEYCRRCGRPADGAWFPIIEQYERDVLSQRNG